MKEIWRGFIVLLFLLIVTGAIYPLLMTGVGQLVFPHGVNGSLIENKGTVQGSRLIGQPFSSPRYFWGRPGGPSNLGPMNPQLLSDIQARIAALQAADPGQKALIPIDLVTSSASGLDPDISVLSAEYQASRVAKARGLTLDQINALIQTNITPPQFGFMGQTRVNVLKLNLALDQRSISK